MKNTWNLIYIIVGIIGIYIAIIVPKALHSGRVWWNWKSFFGFI